MLCVGGCFSVYYKFFFYNSLFTHTHARNNNENTAAHFSSFRTVGLSIYCLCRSLGGCVIDIYAF